MRWPRPSGVELVPGARVSDGFFRTLGVAPVAGPRLLCGRGPAGQARDGHHQPRRMARPLRRTPRRHRPGRHAQRRAAHHRRRAAGALSVRARRGAPSSGRRCTRPADATCGEAATACSASARLKDGVTIEEAHAEMKGIAAQLEREYPDSNRGQGASRRSARRGDRRRHPADAPAAARRRRAAARDRVRQRRQPAAGALGGPQAGAGGAQHARRVQWTADSPVRHRGRRCWSRPAARLGLLLASSAVQLLFGLISEDMRAQMPYLDGVGMNSRVAACAGVLALLATAICLAGSRRARALQRDARGPGRRRARLVGQRLAAPRLQAGGAWNWRRRWCCWSARGCWARACTACSTSISGSSPIVSRPCRWLPRARASRATSSSPAGARGRQPGGAPARRPVRRPGGPAARQLQRQHELDQVRGPARTTASTTR